MSKGRKYIFQEALICTICVICLICVLMNMSSHADFTDFADSWGVSIICVICFICGRIYYLTLILQILQILGVYESENRPLTQQPARLSAMAFRWRHCSRVIVFLSMWYAQGLICSSKPSAQALKLSPTGLYKGGKPFSRSRMMR